MIWEISLFAQTVVPQLILLLTNVSKRGRPPKVKEEDAPVLEDNDNKSIQVEEQINSDDSTDVGVDIENDDESMKRL